MKSAEAELDAFLTRVVEGGTYSCAAGLVGTSARVLWTGAAGLEQTRPRLPASSATLFDLGSITKPFMATLALHLDASGLLPLRTRVAEVWPAADPRFGEISLQDLLRHRSGLNAWAPLYHLCADQDGVLAALLSGSGLGAKRGVYSDLGYILWGFAAEQRLIDSLWRLLSRQVLAPLGLKNVRPSPGAVPGAAACLIDTGKEVELAAALGLEIEPLPPPAWGRVQDGNARFLGGLAGHAGLFGTVEDLWRLAREWIEPRVLLPLPRRREAVAGPGSFGLGWWKRSASGSAGRALSTRAFGHPGFPGGSVWADPEADLILVLLGHRTSPFSDLTPLRREFNRLGARQLSARPVSRQTPSSKPQ